LPQRRRGIKAHGVMRRGLELLPEFL
jgi:hypothetical protein